MNSLIDAKDWQYVPFGSSTQFIVLYEDRGSLLHNTWAVADHTSFERFVLSQQWCIYGLLLAHSPYPTPPNHLTPLPPSRGQTDWCGFWKQQAAIWLSGSQSPADRLLRKVSCMRVNHIALLDRDKRAGKWELGLGAIRLVVFCDSLLLITSPKYSTNFNYSMNLSNG